MGFRYEFIFSIAIFLSSPVSIFPDLYFSYISESLESSSSKSLRYWKETSTSGLPPVFLCSSVVFCPPEKAYLLILFLTWFGVSVKAMYEFGSDADILSPFSPGRNR